MPIESPLVCMGFSAAVLLTAVFLLPGIETAARRTPLVADALDGAPRGWGCLRIAEWAMAAAAYLCAGMFQARCLQLCYPDFYDPYAVDDPVQFPRAPGAPVQASPGRNKRHGFEVAGMPVDHDELRTSILVTGVTGSSKTAGVLMPALAQLFAAYNEETADGSTPNGFEKLGAFIPEVKGDLVDACVYLAHEAGRCVSRDVIILSPSCRVPVARYRDERGRAWFLSARGGAGGSDAGELLAGLRFPTGHPRAGRAVPQGVFEIREEFEAILPELSGTAVPVGGRRPRFVGWRWEGERLRRVSHTVARDRQAPLAGPDGRPLLADPPQTLTLDGVTFVDNGVHFNLVDPRLPAAEAAERLTRLAAMARGSAGRGENDYFYDQGRKVIAACIALHRAVESAPCTAVDIVRLATQDQRLASGLEALSHRIERLAAAAPSDEARGRELAPLTDLLLFFRDEWRKMVADGKTANVIKSTISGAFDIFLQDPNLAETFCRPSTFSFEDIAQSGRIIALVPGDRYEQLGRLLGTACKLDFQSAMLSRNGRADMNSSRLALYFADECHKYVISGSSTAGDPYFMNLSRSNNVVNICATQSYAWLVEVIGREAANVYISAFGVQFWLQQTDPETCRRASEICGRVTREKVSAEHNFDFAGFLGALAGRRGMEIRHRVAEEERERFRPEDFSHLNVGDIIAYNKGRPGRNAKVAKGRASYTFCTEKPAGLAAVNLRMREYYREILENLAHDRGQDGRWDCAPRPADGIVAAAAPVADPVELTSAASVERERTEFKAHLGSLDSAVAALEGIRPGSVGIALEDSRRRAGEARDPAGQYGEALRAGFDGVTLDARPPAEPVNPDAAALPGGGDMALRLAGEAAHARAAREGAGRAARRREAPRPRPAPLAFAGQIP